MQISTSQTRGKILRHHLATKTTPDRTEKRMYYFEWLFGALNGFSSVWDLPMCDFESKNWFCRGYFEALKFFLVGISWIQKFFSWFFVRPKFFLVSISWFKVFDLLAAWERVRKKRSTEKRSTSQTMQPFLKRFQQLSILFILEKYFIYQITYAITQLSFVLTVFYTAFICTNCIFIRLFSSVLEFLHS